MSLEHLDLAVFRYQQAALAPSTQSTYSSGVRSYRLFCVQTGSLVLPLTELTLQRYAASMANRVGFKTIKVYLCGVQYLSIMSGFDVQISSFMRLYYTLRGIRCIQGSRFGRQRRLPISISQLLFIHHRVQLQRYSHFEGLMLRTSTSLAFFGLLRCSEFTTATRSSFDVSCDLLVQDISFSGAFSIMKVHIKASKTDPFREGCWDGGVRFFWRPISWGNLGGAFAIYLQVSVIDQPRVSFESSTVIVDGSLFGHCRPSFSVIVDHYS